MAHTLLWSIWWEGFRLLETGNPNPRGYLVCSQCGGYYKLKEGESPSDFVSCECGGPLKYYNLLEEAYAKKPSTLGVDESTKRGSSGKSESKGESIQKGEKLSLTDFINEKGAKIEGGNREEIIGGLVRDKESIWDDRILEDDPNFVSTIKKQREKIKMDDMSKESNYYLIVSVVIVIFFIVLFISLIFV